MLFLKPFQVTTDGFKSVVRLLGSVLRSLTSLLGIWVSGLSN